MKAHTHTHAQKVKAEREREMKIYEHPKGFGRMGKVSQGGVSECVRPEKTHGS